MKQVDVVIGIVVRAGQVLICQRLPDAPLGGYWEFPGGKREPGETDHQCLARELLEETGVTATPTFAFDVIEHAYPTATVRLHPYLCAHATGEPRPLACQQVHWIAPAQLRDYTFPPANDALLEKVIAHLSRADGVPTSPSTRPPRPG